MYGELDPGFVTAGQEMARRSGGVLVRTNTTSVPQSQAYVGNVAWGFVCAEVKLHKEWSERTRVTTGRVRGPGRVDEFCNKLRRRSTRLSDCEETLQDNAVEEIIQLNLQEDEGKNVFYLTDDTPPVSPLVFQEPFLIASGYKVMGLELPVMLVIAVFFLLRCVLRCLRLLGSQANFPVSHLSLYYMQKPFLFSYEKAREQLRYNPIYSPDEARQRSMGYYIENSYT